MQKQLRFKTLAPTALVLSFALAFSNASAQTTEAQLLKRLDDLAAELNKVKSELKQMKDKQDAAPAPAETPTAGSNAASATQLTSYGEISYSRPSRDTSATQATVGRFVLGFNHRFNERTKAVAELEVENAVTSAGDSGEVAVEQVYVEHKLNDTYGLRAGLFLMPIGLINQNHEPTSYYGVFRPAVETQIIPSTLREIGLQVFGEHDNGISWTAGLSTAPDLTKWDPTDAQALESPLRAIHQEGQLAKARNLSMFGAVDWRGMPGLRIGAGAMSGKIGHGTAGFAANNARYTLWDIHAKWTPGPWDLSAVYARGSISGAGNLNATFAGAPYLVPKTFDGLSLQAAYKFRLAGDYTVSPFVRLESVNTGRSFDGVVPGLNVDSYATERITTVGANFNVTPAVVFKADVQRYKIAKDSNRFNLGLGYSF
jgi:Phosphate-selective porin O and P